MCNFETSVSVWTHRFDKEWMDNNGGCSDVLLVDGIRRGRADGLVERLKATYGDDVLEIRDIHNVCVWSDDESLIGKKRDARLRQEEAHRKTVDSIRPGTGVAYD